MKKALMVSLLGLLSLLLVAGCDGGKNPPTYTEATGEIQTNVGREFIIALDANPTTGYAWTETYDDSFLELVSKEYKADQKADGLLGSGGTQYYRFQAKNTGSTGIKLTYLRSWEENPVEEQVFNVVIAARYDSEGGNMSTRDYQYEGFNKIEVSGAFEVEINQGETWLVSVTADDYKHIRVEKVGNTLQIGRQGIEWFAGFHQQPKAHIVVPSLESVKLSGATRGTLSNVQTAKDLMINVSGASNLQVTNVAVAGLVLEITGASTLKGSISATADAKFEVSGASKLELNGVVRDITANISGASKAELYGFPTRNSDMEVSGASSAYINTNGKLDAKVSGASTLVWTGNPIMGDINTSGASTLRHK